MKKIIIAALLCTIPLLIAMGGKPNVGSVGVINNQALFTQSKIVEEINNKFMELEVNATKEVELLQERIEALKLTEAEKQLVEDIQIQSSIFMLQNTLEEYQNAILTEVDAKFNSAIEMVRNNRKMSVIIAIESALSYDPNADITEDVIKAIDAMNIVLPEIPDLTLPEPTKP